MNTDRKIAITTGILFIVATAAGILGSNVAGPIVDAPDYLARAAANGNGMIIGTLLTFVAAATSAGIAIALHPVLKRHSPGLALGAVGFRLIEAVFYIAGALCLLSLLPLGARFVNGGGQDVAYFETLGHMLRTGKDLAGFVFGVLAFCIGGLCYYVVFYRSKLIPRWLSAWGLIAMVLLMAGALLAVFDGEPYSVSGSLMLLAAPIALQEMVLAVWLIAKGFSFAAVDLGPARAQTSGIQEPASG